MGDPDTQASSKLPDQFGNYAILKHLATGGMAEVYLARQTGLQGFEKTVVIKRVRPELMSDRDVTGSFLDEARLVATLQHPNIAQVYEIGLVNGTYFLVMEYVHGADLRQLMERAGELGQGVTIADAIYILIQACVALHYAHEKRGSDGQRLDIIHRDVTPSNVLLSHDGAVKVCDFGIAKATNRTTETARGALKGKYAYMSPEQCKCTQLDRRSDIFALGILLYELSTLTRPFAADSDFELLRAIIEEPPPPPSSRIDHYPSDLERIVLRALAKDPNSRYPTAQAMQLDLEAFAREYRLALSSVNIANLMAELFNDRVDAFMRERGAEASYEPLLETAARTLGKRPSAPPVPPAHASSASAPDLADSDPDLVDSDPDLVDSDPDLADSDPDLVDSDPDLAIETQPVLAALALPLRVPLMASTPNAPSDAALMASAPNAPTRVPLVASTPNAPSDAALMASTPNAPTRVPLMASMANAPTRVPLMASTPNAPTRVPLMASTPNAPTQAPLMASTPNAPTRVPLMSSTPNAPTRATLTTSTPNAPTYVPFGAAPNAPLETPPASPAKAPVALDTSHAGARVFPVGTHLGADPRPARPSALWLIAAFAGALFAAGVSIAGRLIDRAASAASATILDGDADQLAATLDAGMRSAQLRANAIAATPVLRVAIDTDAATLRDLAEREYAFSVGPSETLEIFQTRNGKTTSLLRLPETAPRLEPLAGTAARVQLLGDQVAAVAGAPISTTAGVRGSLAVTARVDLSPATRQLAEHAVAASLRGHDLDVRLVDRRDAHADAPRGTPRTIPLRITGELGAGELSLVATPIATAITWVAAARLAGIAAAILLVICYLLSFWRIRAATRGT